jgi:hydrogenase maturation protein HypF
MACAWLAASFDGPREPPRQLARQIDERSWDQVSKLAVSGVASPLTTSAGRLFDAVAALCGLRAEVNYEGQAAVELEAACDPGERGAYDLPLLEDGGGPLVLDARPLIRAVVADLEGGIDAGRVAARFHNGLADGTARACALTAGRRGTDLVVLSGGVFQNRRLLGQSASLLADAGLTVLTPERLPPNDGGIAYGQLAVAAARLAAEDPDVRV